MTNNEEAEALAKIIRDFWDEEIDKHPASESDEKILAQRILAARRPSVPVDNSELIAEIESRREFYGGDYEEGSELDLMFRAALALASQQPREAAPSDTDREFKRIPVETRAELIHMAEGRIKDVWADVPEGVDAATLASNVVAAQEFVWMQLAAGVDLRTSHPVQVEVTDEMVERAARLMFEPPSLGPVGDSGYTWTQMVHEDPSRADMWRQDARAALSDALASQQPCEVQTDKMRGYSLWFCREDWGHITDALIDSRQKAIERAGKNSESTSNERAEQIKAIIRKIGEVDQVTPESTESEDGK